MNEDTIKKLAETVYSNNKFDLSITCLAEECSELIQECMKFQRGKITNMTMEIAHVLLMVEVIKIGLDIKDYDLMLECNSAVERMLSRVKGCK